MLFSDIFLNCCPFAFYSPHRQGKSERTAKYSDASSAASDSEEICQRLSTIITAGLSEDYGSTLNVSAQNVDEAAKERAQFLEFLKGECKLTAAQFREVWMHYDTNNNGYIEETEIDRFLIDLFEAQGHSISKKDVGGLKHTLMECYDTNKDGKIEVCEMYKILPVEENFLLKFKIANKPLTFPNFLRIWEYYDSDRSGKLERSELEDFITDLIKTNKNIVIKSNEMNLIMDEIYSHFDENSNRLIEQWELTKLLQVPENYLERIELYKNLNKQEFSELFEHYDRNCDGYLEGEELLEIVSDMMRKVEIEINMSQLEKLVDRMVRVIDVNYDGKISKRELANLFFVSGQISPFEEPGSGTEKVSSKRGKNTRPKS